MSRRLWANSRHDMAPTWLKGVKLPDLTVIQLAAWELVINSYWHGGAWSGIASPMRSQDPFDSRDSRDH
jgi:hypothetical protein